MRMSPKENMILSQIKVGRQRRLVFCNVDSKPLLVSEIYRKVNKEIKDNREGKEIRLSDVSRALQDLVKLGVVKCLNPRKRVGDKGILYHLTQKGEILKSCYKTQ